MPLLHDVAHLGHAELLTPEPEKSLWFFTEVLGLTENGTSGDSVYLRTWDDYEHHSLKLTASATSGIAPHRAARQQRGGAEAAGGRRSRPPGLGIGWRDGDTGIGPTYLCRDPDGHEFELYWETEWYRPTGELKPALKNQAQAYPGRGVCVRRLDHVNFLAAQTKPNGGLRRLGARRPGDRADRARRRHDLRAVAALRAEVLRPRLHQRLDRVRTGGCTTSRSPPTRARTSCGPRTSAWTGGVHRDRAAQARHPADVLPLRVRAGREPDRAVQPLRAADLRARLGPAQLDRGRAGQGAGLGTCHHPVVSHATGPRTACRALGVGLQPDGCRAGSRLAGGRGGPRRDLAGTVRARAAAGRDRPLRPVRHVQVHRRGPPCRTCPRRGLSSSSATGARGCARYRSPRRSRSPRCACCWRACRRHAPRSGSAPAEAALLRVLVQDMRAAVAGAELLRYSELNASLHGAIRDIAAHETSARLLRQLRDQTVRHRFSLSLVPGRPRVAAAARGHRHGGDRAGPGGRRAGHARPSAERDRGAAGTRGGHPAMSPDPLVVAVLGLGEAGSAIAADLYAAGAVVRGFDPRVPAGAGVTPCTGDADACRGAAVVVSLTCAHEAEGALVAALPAHGPRRHLRRPEHRLVRAEGPPGQPRGRAPGPGSRTSR